MKLKAAVKFYVAQPRPRLAFALVARKANLGGAYQGRHRWLPLEGQLAITTDLHEATADECDGQQFPAGRCERALPVRKMSFDASNAAWEITVPTPPLTRGRCLDYLQLSSGGDPPAFSLAAGGLGYALRAKMLRGKTFKVTGKVAQQYGKGTLRMAWTFTFTRLR